DEGDDEQVTVDMGVTRFDPAALPFDTAGLRAAPQGSDTLWQLDLLDAPAGLPRRVQVSAVAISNPHAVQQVDDVDAAPVAAIGPLVEQHPRFARRVNRSEEHTSELQSRENLVCRLLLEKKKKNKTARNTQD